jgi:hypothetical protein
MLYDLSNALARDVLSRADLGQCRGWAAPLSRSCKRPSAKVLSVGASGLGIVSPKVSSMLGRGLSKE